MEILEAYCVELGRVVNIYEAREEFFALRPAHRKRFTFLCSDDHCRDVNKTRVTGVNYDKLAEECEKYRQMHFRASADHPHIDNCAWMQGHMQRSASGDMGDAGNRKSREKHAKSTNVIDEFNPKTSDPLIAASYGKLTNNLPADRDSTSSDTPGRMRARDGRSSTSRLERFIDCWSQYKGDELKQHWVKTKG